MTSAEQIHAQLTEAMADRTPGCLGIEEFTADHLTAPEATFLGTICAACELQLLCRRYVEADPPPVGFWAGRDYGRRTRPRTAA